MDRFIDYHEYGYNVEESDLKSNMDRFIAPTHIIIILFSLNLKSNMDRFIELNTNIYKEENFI